MNLAEQRRSRVGFTLLEMITVIAIMFIIMTAAVTSFVGLRRGAEMQSAVSSLRSTLALARQFAVTKRERVFVTISPGASSYMVTNYMGPLGELQFLPPGIAFTNTPAMNLVFLPGGGLGVAGNVAITVTERAGNQTTAIMLYGLTGLTAK